MKASSGIFLTKNIFKYGMNEDQFQRLCGVSELRREIAETIQGLKDSTEFFMRKLLSLQEQLANIEVSQKEENS